MHIMKSVSAAALLVAGAFLARVALAEEVPKQGNSPTQVEGRCNESGGIYSAPGSQGVYYCLNNDGSGIVCGGVGKYAKTCTKFGPKVVKHRSQVPVRAEIIKAERQRLLKAGK
jgi:hypothetical protein